MNKDEILEEKIFSKKRMPDMIRRMRILYIKEYLEDHTDERFSASMSDIIKYLEKKGIPAERKSVRDDILALIEYGMDICLENGKQWKLLSRGDFDLAEVKLIADCVVSSRILSAAKSRELIEKLGKLVGLSERSSLGSDVMVVDRIKTVNQITLYNIDAINTALASGKDIEFRYFQYNMKKERIYRHEGKIYHVHPRRLIYANNIYYILAQEGNELKTFRVDRMDNVTIDKRMTRFESPDKYDLDLDFGFSDEEIAIAMAMGIDKETIDRMKLRSGKKDAAPDCPPKPILIDDKTYIKSTFGMYHGEETEVTMLFAKDMMDTVIDRFGEDVNVEIVDENHFRITETVAVSPQFFGWIFGLGENVMIETPYTVAKQMKDMLKERHKAYREEHTRNIYYK